MPSLARVEMPESLSSSGIGGEGSAVIPQKYQTATGGEHTSPTIARPHLGILPDNPAGLNVSRPQVFLRVLVGNPVGNLIDKGFARSKQRRPFDVNFARLERLDVEQVCLWTPC